MWLLLYVDVGYWIEVICSAIKKGANPTEISISVGVVIVSAVVLFFTTHDMNAYYKAVIVLVVPAIVVWTIFVIIAVTLDAKKTNREFLALPVPCKMKGFNQTVSCKTPLPDAIESSIPNIQISLLPHVGISVGPQNGLDFDTTYRKQYSLVFSNIGGSEAKNLNFTIRFPYPVEAERIVGRLEVSDTTLIADRFTMNVVGNAVNVRFNGCPASHTSTLHIGSIQPKGRVEIAVLLNRQPRHPGMSVRDAESGYVMGDFYYSYRRKRTKSDKWYAPMETKTDSTVVLKHVATAPAITKITTTKTEMDAIPAPCIADEVLSK